MYCSNCYVLTAGLYLTSFWFIQLHFVDFVNKSILFDVLLRRNKCAKAVLLYIKSYQCRSYIIHYYMASKRSWGFNREKMLFFHLYIKLSMVILNIFQEILDRTGYSLDVTTGQRKYGGPPPGCEGDNPPGPGHEVK